MLELLSKNLLPQNCMNGMLLINAY